MADISTLLPMPLPEFDPYELDPSEEPRWNLLARMWSQIQTRVLATELKACKLTPQREDFLSLTYISRWFGTSLVSPFLKRPIETIDDYIAHCSAQAEKWEKEDQRQNRSGEFFKRKSGSSELDQARREWKQAIQRRKDALKLLDEDVRRCHAIFVRIRDGA